MKILVTGAQGMLGKSLVRKLSATGHRFIGTDINDLDITDLQAILDYIKKCRPDVVVNTAAFTDVDACEFHRELAYRVNGMGPRNLAVACEEVGAALVHVSTDYVFSGKNDVPYNEYSQTGPLNVYGWSKLAGELNVCRHINKFYILRSSWLFGSGGKNFVSTILRLADEKKELSVVHDQTGVPTYSEDLATAIIELVSEPAYGFYHITNTGSCSWFEFAKEILAEAGREDVEVKPVTTSEINRPAHRPRYSVLENLAWKALGKKPLPHYRHALKKFLLEE